MDKNKFKQRMKDYSYYLLIYIPVSIASGLITKRIDFTYQSILESLFNLTKRLIIAYLVVALFWYLFGLTEKKK